MYSNCHSNPKTRPTQPTHLLVPPPVRAEAGHDNGLGVARGRQVEARLEAPDAHDARPLVAAQRVERRGVREDGGHGVGARGLVPPEDFGEGAGLGRVGGRQLLEGEPLRGEARGPPWRLVDVRERQVPLEEDARVLHQPGEPGGGRGAEEAVVHGLVLGLDGHVGWGH